MGFIGLEWVLLGLTGFCWVGLGFNRFLSRFYYVRLGVTVLERVLMGFNGLLKKPLNNPNQIIVVGIRLVLFVKSSFREPRARPLDL